MIVAVSHLAYLRPEEANMAVCLAESQPVEPHSLKIPTGCQAAGWALGTQAGRLWGGAGGGNPPRPGSRCRLGQLVHSGLLRRCQRGNYSGQNV